jgi:NAD(P)-dependent dehydrogenase (short-subunit alcohol dehydrogenase family)
LEVSPSGPTVRVIVATSGAESVLNESVRNPATALALGPVLALPTEVPQLHMRAVDLDLQDGAKSVDAAATALVEEAANADRENLVAWRGGCRWKRRFERLSLPPVDSAQLPLKPRGVYLITGGLGGIGLTLAHWFAVNASARLMLTARSPLPPREEWDEWLLEHRPNDQTATIIRTIREIEEKGGEVLTAAVNAADLNQMKGVIELIRERWGRIDGVVHAAGVPGSGRIAFLKQSDDIQSVVSPKVDGLDVLVRLLGNRPLDFVALISSINSLLGAPGLSDYAGANAILDAFPDSELCPASWKRVVSVNWGTWRDLGMAARLFEANPKTDLEVYRQTTISPQAGTEAFARVLSSRNKRVIVVPFDIVRHLELLLKGPSKQAVTTDRLTSAAIATPARGAQERPEIATAYEPPSTETERFLAEIWNSLLGVERIGIDDNFFELGGHSLLATRVLARIGDSLRVRLTLRNIFDAPTIRGLAAAILRIASEGEVAQLSEDREEIVF